MRHSVYAHLSAVPVRPEDLYAGYDGGSCEAAKRHLQLLRHDHHHITSSGG